MAHGRWDDGLRRFPASRPLQAHEGIATSKRRGRMADTWWSSRFVEVLESYGLGGRMQRGRRYARVGQILSLDVAAGLLVSQVQGSRRTPYVVTVRPAQPSDAQWARLDDTFSSRVGFAARLLAGEVPPDLEQAFADTGLELIPSAWEAMGASCTCPDDQNPCKHIAAVLYVLADQLDRDPWLLLALRGRTRDELLGRLGASGGPADPRLPPWWPLVPGGRGRAGPFAAPPPAAAPVPPARVLHRLEPLDVPVGAAQLVDLLAEVYGCLSGALPPEGRTPEEGPQAGHAVRVALPERRPEATAP